MALLPLAVPREQFQKRTHQPEASIATFVSVLSELELERASMSTFMSILCELQSASRTIRIVQIHTYTEE